MIRTIGLLGILLVVSTARVEAGTRVVRSPQFGFSQASAQAQSFGGGYSHQPGPDFGDGGFGGGGGFGGNGGYGGNGGFGGGGYGGNGGFGGGGFGGGAGFGGGVGGGFGGGAGLSGGGGFGGRGFGGPGGFGRGFGNGFGHGPQGSLSISKSISINAGPGGGLSQASSNAGSFGKR